MKFLVLVRKELRECLPWMLLAAIFFLVFGGLGLRALTSLSAVHFYRGFSPYSIVSSYQLTQYPPLQVAGSVLFLTSLGLGLVLGGRQFWMAHFTKTWGFTLHRSVSRETILGAKLAAAIAGFVISLGAVWLGLYWYVCRLEYLPVPPTIRVFVEGWIFIALGLVVYLGTALAGLSRARWYTTKMFGVAFAVLIVATTIAQWRLLLAFSAIVVGVVILLLQIIDAFLNREF